MTAPKARDLEYNTRSQNLVIAGSTSNGKMLYSLDGESYSQSVPTAINAGTYTVYYKVEETDNYSGVSGSVETTIKKIAPTVSAPTPIENLEFNGSPQELVVAGEANSGPMLYRLCKSLSGSNCSEFSEEIPTATNAQQYLINVWVKATDNYEAYHGTYSVTIAKAKAKITTEAEAKNLTYSGKSQELVTAASTNNSICSVVYSTDETNYSEKISTAVNAGTYTVWYKLNPNCYSDEEIRQIEVTIGKAKPTVTMATGIKGLVYNGKAQKLVVAGSANSGPTLYSLDGKNFSEEIPTATDAGAYYIYQQVKETKNYAEFTAKVEPFPIEIKPLEVTPYTLTGRILEYNGKAQELVTPGPAGVCLLYYLGENPTSLDDFSRKIPTAVEIGQYVIFYELDRKNCVSDKFNGDFRSTIEKGIAPEPQGITLTYNGEPQELTDAEPNACISYSLDKEHFSTEIPKAVNADQYYVTYKVDLEHCVSKNSREYGDFKSLIERATVTEPRAKLLAYSGKEQELIIPGEPSACLGYSLGKEYSTQIPTGKEPKDYKINYKVIDSKNCYETSGNVTAIIDKNMKLTPPQAIAKVLNFTGEKQKLIIPGSSEYGTMLYSLDGINYEKDVPVAIDPGFYTIHFKVDYSENFYISEGTVSTIIAEKPANFAFVDVFMMNKKTYATLDGDYIEKEAFKPEEISIDTVIFNRKFPITNGNNYSTLMLPFDAELDQLEGVSESNVFEFVGVRRNETTKALQVEIASVSRIKAYTPYIVQMNKQTLQINGPVVLRKLTDKPITTVEDWTLIGTIDYTEWNKESKDLGRIYGFSAYPFDSKAGKHYDAGQFIKFSPGSFIKPMRAYLFYGGKVTNNAPVPKGEESSIASIDEELPDRMDVVIVDRRGEEEHTTVIGSFSPRTGEFRINRNYGNRTFDLKGRNIGKPRAKGIYLKK
ncbi:hypothetical protein [uncultured Fibrobacter sp.]|uniref:hypothetical protein n=1 Tax=uncultured Fibrobacter sp. TaxID=261512 RepID=UPI0026226897|nr:hypothetical protein [uncultured Fibrobacter sp.]